MNNKRHGERRTRERRNLINRRQRILMPEHGRRRYGDRRRADRRRHYRRRMP